MYLNSNFFSSNLKIKFKKSIHKSPIKNHKKNLLFETKTIPATIFIRKNIDSIKLSKTPEGINNEPNNITIWLIKKILNRCEYNRSNILIQ